MNYLKHFVTRVGVLIICVLCFAVSALAAQQDDPVATRVHYRPSQSSTVIGQLENGTRVNLLGSRGTYYKIDCYDMTGYISKGQVEKRGEEYYVNCDPEHADTVELNCISMEEALLQRSSIKDLCQTKLGGPYVYGGNGPRGFDCSGFSSYIYRKHQIQLLRCADQQMSQGIMIPKDSLQAGDLVFFREPYSPWLATHVGVYVGNNQMIHSDSGGVRYTDLDHGYYYDTYVGARRILNVSTQGIEMAPTAASVMPAVAATAFSLSPRTAPGSGLRTAG